MVEVYAGWRDTGKKRRPTRNERMKIQFPIKMKNDDEFIHFLQFSQNHYYVIKLTDHQTDMTGYKNAFAHLKERLYVISHILDRVPI